MDDWPTCEKCGNGLEWIDCGDCGGEGFKEEDEPENFRLHPAIVQCQTCGGDGGWDICPTCDATLWKEARD